MGVLLDHAVVWIGRDFLAHQPCQGAFLKGAWMPFARIVGLDSSHIQPPMHPCHRAVAEERQWLGSRHLLILRQVRACVADGQERGGSPATRLPNDLTLTCRMYADSSRSGIIESVTPSGRGRRSAALRT